ncbi:MAG TPA: membrane dipeptidase [Candidatus Acidoferrales bacterium]|nr:membrane dipeptidase [Candidatus Acidoferrales bacterium]
MRGLLRGVGAAVVVVVLAGFTLGPALLERSINTVLQAPPYPVNEATHKLHTRLFVADLHADPLLWNRDLLNESAYGHVDIPRLRRGGVALQVFDAVTKTPRDQNYDGNTADSDNITALAIVQLWPVRTWRSLPERALYQAQKLHDVAARSKGRFVVVRSKADIEKLVQGRAAHPPLTGGLLGIEGLHALEGDLHNLDVFFDAGFRIMGLTHFFDNEVGGSAHGTAKGGLTDFGRQVVRRMEERQILIDLAHASPQVIDDVLALATRPLVVSHTGVKGNCDNIRNISDEHLRRIAAGGGVVGIGYWDAAVCDVSVAGIVRAIQYAVRVAGVDHVALGSDFDGATTTPFDTTGVAQITEGLMSAGVSDNDIGKIMGGNVLRLLRETLPAA